MCWWSAVSQTPRQAEGPTNTRRRQVVSWRACSLTAEWRCGPCIWNCQPEAQNINMLPFHPQPWGKGLLEKSLYRKPWECEVDQSQLRGGKWRRKKGIGLNLMEVKRTDRKRIKSMGKEIQETSLLFPKRAGESKHHWVFIGHHTLC